MELLKEGLHAAGVVWSYALFTLDGQPMTVGKLITGVILLIIGLRLSKRAADVVDERFLARLDVDLSMRFTLRRVFFYFLVVVVTLTVLRALSVPITVFTVIGGALALGFGFGSQHVVSNFISGIIMMIERPIRVGDLISVDGNDGTVETIGIRATHLSTADNKKVIIPNSFFLEKAVINSTLNDDVIRREVTVGVAYGSNPGRVRELLEEAWRAHSDILRTPTPRILFQDFGDNALIFTVQFWVRLGGERLAIEVASDLRFLIADIFGREGVAIPFPQRDVRIDFTRPVPVEVKGPTA